MIAKEALAAVKEQLAADLNCNPGDFEKEGIIFCEAKENPGRRPFPRDNTHFEMLTMGKGVVVSATADILSYLEEELHNKTRDEAFNMPFVRGMGIYFLPGDLALLPYSEGYSFSFIEKEDIPKLYSLEGFDYTLNRGADHPRPTVLALTANKEEVVAGMAAASNDCHMLWQIGIDVAPAHRGGGLAAVLTGRLADCIISRGKVPYYGTAAGNIPSQRTAVRAGLVPAWSQAYRGCFDGVMTAPTG